MLNSELAKQTAEAGILRWPVKPKHHVTRRQSTSSVGEVCMFVCLVFVLSFCE